MMFAFAGLLVVIVVGFLAIARQIRLEAEKTRRFIFRAANRDLTLAKLEDLYDMDRKLSFVNRSSLE